MATTEPIVDTEANETIDLLLETRNLTRRFGSLVAVDNVNLSIPPGEFHSIIGPNGAGKTTLFNMIAGTLAESEGAIIYKGTDITGTPEHERAQQGISRAFQMTQLFPNLSISENLRLAVQGQEQNFNPFSSLDPTHTDRADEMLSGIDIDARPSHIAKNLSHGGKKKLEIAMALSVDPELLLLDEPTSGVSQAESRPLMDFLSESSQDRTVLLIEHNVDFVLEISDRVTVLDDGSVISQGTPAQIEDDAAVQEAYMGAY
jgi:branched-chain amino acid transport system ATP-binding protein